MKKLPPIIILAGGKAKRLRPITKKIPKSMVLINKKPFIEYQIDQLKKYIDVPMTILGGAGSESDLRSAILRYGNIGVAAGSHFIYKGKYKAVLISYPDNPREI